MPVRDAAFRSSRFHLSFHAALLTGVSALTLLAAPSDADARDVLRGTTSPAAAAAMATASAQQAAAVAKLSQDALARATQSIQAMRTAQSAARNLALAAPSTISDGLSANPGLTPGLVPDSGLAASGVANPVTSWIGAQTPTQATSNGQTAVTIQQTAPQALLNWTSFNVSKNTTVNFNQQGNSSWVALNNITDSAGAPSRILGSIRADGSVYLINQNGIIFGGSSQVNVHTLIASSLPVTDLARFLTGTGILGTLGDPATNTNAITSFSGTANNGQVLVQAGAQITAPGGQVLLLAPKVENDGTINTPLGQTLLLGGSDVVLVTGDSYTRGFIVGPNNTAPTYPNGPSSNISPGGVTISYSSTQPGTAVNNGSISAPQGNITIVAGQITQNGILTSTTSTAENGSITLRAETGNLLVGGRNDNPLYATYGVSPQPSLIQILPDSTDRSLVTDAQAIANSSISLIGTNIGIGGIVQLHGYDVTNANDHPGGIAIIATGTVQSPIGEVFLTAGSLLDGSGTTDATASASRNSVPVELRTNELRDSPLVRAGPLYQKTINVDVSASGINGDGSSWVGTPLADASAWIALTTRSLDERMMNGAPITIGGAINQNTTGAFPVNLVQAPGSIINVSGGYLTYTPGFIRVSRLLTADGHLVSVTNADPTVPYVGICCSFTVNHPHWGVTETFADPLVSQGYASPGFIQGGAAGSLTLNVSAAVLAGSIYASVVQGERQGTLATAPAGAALTVNGGIVTTFNNGSVYTVYNADNIILSDSATGAAADWVAAAGFDVTTSDLNALLQLQPALPNSVYLPISWLNSGFTQISLGANNAITLPASTATTNNTISLRAGGKFSASAALVDIGSAISVPSGTIALTGDYTANSTITINHNGSGSVVSGLVTVAPGVTAGSGVTIESGVTLSAAGLWTNDRGSVSSALIAANGGTIAVGSYGDITVRQGSVLDVSGGGYETSAGKITGGKGGTLALTAGLAPKGGSSVFVSLGYVNFEGGLQSGQLNGYGTIGTAGVGGGGTLNLTSSVVATIKAPSDMGGALLSQSSATMDAVGNPYVPVSVSTDLFSAGGFANVGLTAAGIDLPPGVTVAPTVASRLIPNLWAPSATTLAGIAPPILLPSATRPVSSTTLHATGDLWNRGPFGATGYQAAIDTTTVDGLAAGIYSLDIAGRIKTDPKSSVALTGDQIAVVAGTVETPGGSITLGGATYTMLGPPVTYALPEASLTGEGVWLTGAGQLLATGTVTAAPQSNGITYQDVLPGGQVSVNGGYIVLAAGSTVDVSGASGRSSLSAAGSTSFNRSILTPSNLSSLTVANRSLPTVASAGGSISISAGLGAVLEGTLSGKGGGQGAAGGTLSVALAWHSVQPNSSQTTVDTTSSTYVADNSTYLILQPSVGDSLLQLGSDLSTQIDRTIPVSAATIAHGGFSSLDLTADPLSIIHGGGGLAQGYVTFAGNVNLALPNRLSINAATIIVPNGGSQTLSANYFLWQNNGGIAAPLAGTDATTKLTINANNADLVGNLAVQGAQTTRFNVAGDLRLTGQIITSNLSATLPQLAGSLVSAQDLVFNAGQIYPSTDTSFTLASATKILFTANGAPPAAPLSAGGVLNVFAPEIDQSGTLRAPAGTINLGSPGLTDTGTFSTLSSTIAGALPIGQIFDFQTTGVPFQVGQSVTITSPAVGADNGVVTVTGLVNAFTPAVSNSTGLVTSGTLSVDVTALTGSAIDLQAQPPGAFAPAGNWAISTPVTTSLKLGTGGLTSASAGGQKTLYGYVQNGTTWYYNPRPLDTATVLQVKQPPAKQISLAGANIAVASGAVIEAPGGGDLFAGEFVPGTGGSKNVFTGTNVYAVLPGYTGITAYDPGASAGGAALGTQVYLKSVPGLPAGLYTLLPGQYAELPGAFRVTVQTSPGASTVAVTRTPITTVTQADGSSIVSGYFVTPGTGTTDEHWSLFNVMSNPVAQKYSEVDISYANKFFATQAAAQGTAVPRLPQDGGQLSIAATSSLSLQGTGNFSPGPNGLGGLADIKANQILVVDSATRDAIAAGSASAAAYIPGGSLVGGNSNTDAWNPIVLAAGDLARLGVESLLLGGSRSFANDGVHIAASATQIVIANKNDPLALPDIQLIAKVDTQPAVSSGGGNSSLTLATPVVGTGQVVIAPNAVIVASGGVAPGEATTYTLSTNATAPGADTNGTYQGPDVEAYYAAAAANQFGYVRLSGGGLPTITGGNASYAGVPASPAQIIGDNGTVGTFSLTQYPISGSVTVGSGARLISDDSLTVFASSSSRLSPGVTIAAQQVLLRSSQISLGTGNYALPGLVLDQATLNSLAGVRVLTLLSGGEIDLYGALSLGQLDPATGQPILGVLTFDSAGLIEKGVSGAATVTAEQVTFQNSLGGSLAPTPPVGGTALAINATDVRGTDPNGMATGYNNATISLGTGATALAGFGSVDLKSSGQILVTGDGGALSVQAPLTLDAPRIGGGTMTMVKGLPQFGTASYAITVADDPASPASYYAVNLVNSSGATPGLPPVLLGNSLTITGGQSSIGTTIALPGGAFNLTANGSGGNITLGAGGVVDVSGRAVQFVDALTTIGGGNIKLASISGSITIGAGARLDVSGVADVRALNQTSAGTLSLSAPVGGVTIAGMLSGAGPTADSAGSFVLDSKSLDGSASLTYDALAQTLIAGGFAKSWDIRARSGNITIAGLTQARNVTVSTDTGNIDVSGTIDAHGATGGKINLYAGINLTLEATAMLNAHGAIADANGRGGQVWLAADAAGSGTGTLAINLNGGQGPQIDVGADAANSIDSGPVLGGQVTLSTARNASGTGVNLTVTGGSTFFQNFINGIKGESAWDGVVIVGNKVYSYNDATLYLTPSTTVAPSGGVETAAFTTYLNDAAIFMGNESGIWTSLGANGIGLAPNGVLVNIRPGIVVKNSGGDITIKGDALNPVGIDLSGSAFGGSALNTGDTHSLNGHFGQYDQPVVLAIRAAGNLNLGTYNNGPLNTLVLGSLSDGFSERAGGLSGTITGAGASGAAAVFDPAAVGAYNGLSGGLGADSATFFLTAGADTAAASPLAVNASASTGTLTVAGITGNSGLTVSLSTANGTTVFYSVTTDPLYLYNYDTDGGLTINRRTGWNLANFTNYASLLRTGTGNIAISTAKDLILQSPLSLIYSAGTGYNVNGSSAQPLAGFNQYNGILTINNSSIPSRNILRDTLPSSGFPTYGGDVTLAIGRDIVGDMNTTPTNTNQGGGIDQNLPYGMTALGSQLKLQNWYSSSNTRTGNVNVDLGAFNDLYATDAWLSNLAAQSTYYTRGMPANQPRAPQTLTGSYQLAWYTWFPFLENTIGSFGGGNISVKAGGNISNIQFVAPTNARDAGPALVATRYAYNPNLLTNPTDVALALAGVAVSDPNPIVGGYAGLYVQGGGNISVTAGGNIAGVYSYAQNGATALNAGGSVGSSCLSACATTQPLTIPLVIETSTGNVSVQAGRSISISDQRVVPGVTNAVGATQGAFTLSGISLIQNASFLIDLQSPGTSASPTATLETTVLTGLLTSIPTGSLTLQATGSVSLNVGIQGVGQTSPWNTNQGILPAQVNLISLQGDVTNGTSLGNATDGTFITYPDPAGTVNLLARGSVKLNQGFVLSDANPSIMPTLTNIAALLSPFTTTVTAANGAATTVAPGQDRLTGTGSLEIAGANYLAGQDIHLAVLGGDSFVQLFRDTSLLPGFSAPTPAVEAARHASLHVGDPNPARIIALTGDVAEPQPTPGLGTAPGQSNPYLNSAKEVEVYAGRDVINLALLGQNNNSTDVTSIVAGRDVIYNTQPPAANPGQPLFDQLSVWMTAQPNAIQIGGPGNLLVESGRNTDLGISSGIQTFGNFLNAGLPSQGAGVTIETGVGNSLLLNYAGFIARYVNPATDGANLYAEALQLFNAPGGATDPYGYFNTLSASNQDILLNRIFFSLLRDSGREHTGATGDTNSEFGTTIDTLAQFNAAYANYQRLNAVIGTYLPNAVLPNISGGSFLGGLSTVRTRAGGNIAILAPNGQIQVGTVAPPSSFPGYAVPGDPTWALQFGVVSEGGGNVDLYANGNISVNQSRVFTLEGGDMAIVSLNGDIDAGKGAKTVLAIQPPNVTYDGYGNVTITAYGAGAGSGIAVLRAKPNTPQSNVDLIAPRGVVNAGDAGIRVSGNINIAALQVLNAGNIQVGGTTNGIPTVAAPNIGALTAASNTAGAAANAATDAAKQSRSRAPQEDLPSIITVEVIGYGDGGTPRKDLRQEEQPRKKNGEQSENLHQDPRSRYQVVGVGDLTDDQARLLTEARRQEVGR